MRNKRTLLVLTLAAIPAIGLTVAFAQPGGGFRQRGGDQGNGGPGGMRGGMGMGMDPAQIAAFAFNRYSGGQDFIDVNNWIARASQRDPNAKQKIETFLSQQGITNGRVNRDQFTVYIQQQASGAPQGGAPGTTPGGPPGQTPGGPPIDEQRIRGYFNQADENNDGKLSQKEVRAASNSEDRRFADRFAELAEAFDNYDKDHNGTIDFEEFKGYYAARIQARNDQRGPRGQGGPQYADDLRPQEEEKTVVYRRLSDLPKDIPQWFVQVPHRNPGQIALYEWKAAGGTVDDFRRYDRNSDGFVTVEEVMGFQSKSNLASRRGGSNNSQEMSDQPQEETMVVLAGPGAASDEDTLSASIGGDFSMMIGRGNNMGGRGFPGGGNNMGGRGFPGGGNTGGRGFPGGNNTGGRGFPGGNNAGGNTGNSGRGGPPSGNDQRGNRGNRGPGRGGNQE